ncbi:MAG: PD-(D/E)XK nuclease family protein [Firmicutes bacterium]|nr:PD-(D/E)XK nuclease family protein [Bacillota bacterium]
MILTSSCEEQLRSEMYKRIKEDLDAIRSGASPAERVVLIVPAQSTLQAEEDGFKYLGGEGFFDFAVMSGAKLRTGILNETGAPSKTAVNTIGRKMLLRRIASKRKEEMISFRSVCHAEGFLDMAGDFIVQLKQNEVSPSDLAAINEKLSKEVSPLLLSKLSDMQIIYSDYEELMAGKYTDSEDLLAYTAEKVKRSSYIQSSIIWYYDFYSFTKREYEFLKALKGRAAGFNAAVLAGKEIYVCGEETAQKLSSALHIERCDIQPLESGAKELRVIECSSPYSQSRTIASDILSKHRDNNTGYGEMLVLCQDMEGMGENLKRVLGSFGVPVFMDEKRSMQHTLTADAVSSCLEVAVSGFKRQAVLSFIKSGALGLSREEISLFENYVKQYKIFDKGFLKPFKYGRDRLGDEDFNCVETIRQRLEELFIPFAEKLDAAKTASEKSAVLYAFLTEDIDLPGLLESKASEMNESGFLDSAQELTQGFEILTGLMDQMAELFGSENMSSEEYTDLFVSCFADVKIGVLPQAEGRVRIGSVTRTSFSDIKQLYVAGFNDGIIPSDSTGENILTESEISSLAGSGYSFAKSSEVLQKEEMYQIERALCTETEETVICVCMSDLEGNAMRPSALLDDLPQGLKAASFERDIDESEDLSSYIQSKESVFSVLPNMLKKLDRGEPVPEVWKEAYNEVRESSVAKAAAGAVFFSPDGGNLEKELSKSLFEKTGGDYFSPTQLEQYSSCPFKHFVNHGLRPEELNVFDVGSREAGTIYHQVLLDLSEKLTGECIKNGIEMTDPASPWMTVTEDETRDMILKIIDSHKEELLGGVMESDEASLYRVSRIQKVCEVFAKYMIEQVRKGKVSAMYFETKFGRRGFFPPVEIQTAAGKAVIEGQIDRVDILKGGEDRYVKIIDYKSGNKQFDRGKVEAGLDLQLMIYLEGALGSEDSLKPAGVFYYAVKDPERDGAYADVIADEISGDLAQKIAADFALDGIAVDDDAILSAMDEEIKGGKVETTVFKVRRGNKNLISADEMEDLRQVFKEKLTEVCGGLMEGNIEIKPAFYNRENVSCRFCDYDSICLNLLK